MNILIIQENLIQRSSPLLNIIPYSSISFTIGLKLLYTYINL